MDGPSSVRSDEALIARRNPWVWVALASNLAWVCVMIQAVMRGAELPLWLVVLLLLPGLGAAVQAGRRNLSPRLVSVDVAADSRNVTVGERRYPRASITQVVVVPRAHGYDVALERRWPRGPIELRCHDAAHANKLVAMMGWSPTEAVASFRGMSAVEATFWRKAGSGCLASLATVGWLVVVAFSGLGDAALVVGFALSLIGSVALFAAPTRLVVGADGVALRWLWRRRFLGYDVVDHVDIVGSGSRKSLVRFHLLGGEVLQIPIATTSHDRGSATAVKARVDAARAAYRRGLRHGDAGPVQLAEALRRGDRSTDDWIASLRALLELAQHRRAVVTPERLWRVVEDSAAEPLARAAAAVALGSTSEPERVRLRRVAKATASPGLRIALDSVAAGEYEAISETLAELERQTLARLGGETTR